VFLELPLNIFYIPYIYNKGHMKSGIYRILNTVNDKCYYGSSSNIDKRWNGHIKTLRLNQHHNIKLQRAWNKYGESNFKFEVVEECNVDLLLIVEQKYIDSNADGYNIGLQASGGDNLSNNPNKELIISKMKNSLKQRYSSLTEDERKLTYGKPGDKNPMYGVNRKGLGKGRKMSEEQKQKLRKPKRDTSKMGKRDKHGIKNPFYGKTHSEEAKQKMKAAIKENRKDGWLPGNARKISIDGIVFNSLKECCATVGLSATAMINRLKSDKYPTWFYIENTQSHPTIKAPLSN